MYDNKKIFILGMARSGYEVAKFLSKHNCEILITDGKNQDIKHIEELENLGIKVIISDKQDELLDATFDYVIKNPGISLYNKTCEKAKKLNIPIINELEVAYHYLPNVKIIGVTGSNGKTTTVSLIYEILKKANLSIHLGGNIGYPMCSIVDNIKENDIILLELSAQQLQEFNDFKVDISVLTNLSEVHLDHFKTYDNYKRCKKKIFDNQTYLDICILNGTDEIIDLTKDIVSNKIYFSHYKKCDLYIEDNFICYKNYKINLDDIKLKGNHNYENIMCAIAVANEFNISLDIIKNVLNKFVGVEHRLEFVKNINGVEFYNDSKATNVNSTITALSSFNKPIILLLGGLDRNHSFDELIPYMNNVKYVVCYGETKDRIEKFCNDNNIKCYKFDSLQQSVKKSYNLSNKGDIILLSPACASWDQYKCFEDRGNEFKNIINNLE